MRLGRLDQVIDQAYCFCDHPSCLQDPQSSSCLTTEVLWTSFCGMHPLAAHWQPQTCKGSLLQRLYCVVSGVVLLLDSWAALPAAMPITQGPGRPAIACCWWTAGSVHLREQHEGSVSKRRCTIAPGAGLHMAVEPMHMQVAHQDCLHQVVKSLQVKTTFHRVSRLNS